MKRFDYLGDAVWLIAWRKFEMKHFSKHTGSHRNVRSQVIVSNKFMTMIAQAEKIEPIGTARKRYSDGLEHFVGKLEFENPGEGIKTAMSIMARRIDIGKLNRLTHEKVTVRHNALIDPRISQPGRILKSTNQRKILGKFY